MSINTKEKQKNQCMILNEIHYNLNDVYGDIRCLSVRYAERHKRLMILEQLETVMNKLAKYEYEKSKTKAL